MPDDLFVGEWMPLYWQTFLDDVQHLAPELLGGYVLLLGYQWKEGSIPSEAMLQAPIAKLSVPKTRLLMKALGNRFSPHPVLSDALANEFMERVREEQRAKFERASKKGQDAAARRWGHTTGNATGSATGISAGNATGNAPGNADIENRDHHSPSARDDAGARTRDAAKKSPAFGFAEWYYGAAIAAGLYGGHYDSFAWCYGQLDAAEALVGHYGEVLCRSRAQQFLRSDVMPWLRQAKDIKALAKWWDAAELREPAKSEPEEDGVISAWRAREQRDA